MWVNLYKYITNTNFAGKKIYVGNQRIIWTGDMMITIKHHFNVFIQWNFQINGTFLKPLHYGQMFTCDMDITGISII